MIETPSDRSLSLKSLTLFVISLLISLTSVSFAESEEGSQASPNPPESRASERAKPHLKPTAENRFWFGSYGRVGLSVDEEGGEGRTRQITPYAPRLLEDNYLELDVGYHAYQGTAGKVDVVTTIAAFDSLFHYSGEPTAQLALRRVYLEASELGGSPIWVSLGSRWLRGNDIYLMNFWPLDDLNTVGLTIGHRGAQHEAWLHVGVSRLNQQSQTQYVDVPAASNFGAESVLMLNRQRAVFAGLFEKRYTLGEGGVHPKGWKWKLYGELHTLPAGEETLEGSFTDRRTLPDDLGLIAGFQLGLWGVGHAANHLNLWARYARGLAIYDELGTPSGFNRERRSWDAEELRVALAGNWALTQSGRFSVQWGGYLRSYRDADELEVDYDDRVEGSFALRPQLNLGDYFTPAVEVSAQWSQAQGSHPVDLTTDPGLIYQFALIPAISFTERKDLNAFTRPQLRLIYAVTALNDGALARYAPADPRAQQSVTHYVGARAEWWFGRGGGY